MNEDYNINLKKLSTLQLLEYIEKLRKELRTTIIKKKVFGTLEDT